MIRFHGLLLAVLFALGGCAAPEKDQARSLNDTPAGPSVALSQNHLEARSKELKLAIQANPLDGAAHYRLASLLAYQGLDDQAIIGYQRTLTVDPTQTAAYHNMGTLMLKRGDVVPAAELFEAAITNNPDYLPAYNNLGKAYY